MQLVDTIIGATGFIAFSLSLAYTVRISEEFAETEAATAAMFFVRHAEDTFEQLMTAAIVGAAGMIAATLFILAGYPVIADGFRLLGSAVLFAGYAYFFHTLDRIARIHPEKP